jgi:hypothetical protein
MRANVLAYSKKMFSKLTKRRRVRPQSGFGAPDDGLADEDEAVVADVLGQML